MNNKVNKYLNKSSFSKLLLFNWVQTRNSGLFWILLLLNLIAQPLTICLIYYLVGNIYKYEIFVILIPLISSFIQIMFMVYWLYLENKNNSIDQKIFCSKYSRFNIALSRIVLIFISLIPTIVVNSLFSIFFIFQNMILFFGAMLVSNILINIFVYILIICLLVLVSEKIGRIAYIFLSFFLGFITLGASLISRPLTNKSNNYLNYIDISQNETDSNVNLFQTNKLISKNYNDVLVFNNLSTLNLTPDDLIYEINKKSVFYNNFIPSEWLLTFYSSLFSLFNFDLNYSYEPYKLLNVNVNKDVNIDFSDLNNFYVIRPTDINFSKLSNNEYTSLILKDVIKIVDKYNLLNDVNTLDKLNSIFVLNSENNSITNWNSLDKISIDFLKDATGINTEFNQLFYVIKYNNLLSDKLDDLFKKISLIYNNQISLLFKNVLSSPITYINIFQVQNFDLTNLVLNTERFIYDYYPMIEIVDPIKPIMSNDKEFLKNQLIKFNELDNSLMLFLSDLSYLTLKDDNLISFNSVIQKVSNNSINEIKNQVEWNNFVDELSLSYDTSNNFLKTLKSTLMNVFNYTLMNNSYDLSSFSGILNPINGNQNGYGIIFILSYIFLFVLLVSLTIKKYRSYYKQQ